MAIEGLPKTSDLPWHVGHNGATNATRHEVQAWARRLLSSEAHRGLVEKQILAGTLPNPEKLLLYYYAYGKPIEQLNVNVTSEDLSSLSVAELLERAKTLSDKLEEAKALEDAIPAKYKIA